MKNEIQLLEQVGIVKTGGSNYSEIANAFLGTGYTSQAGNTYIDSIRLADGIIIKHDIVHGYARTFLNYVKIYTIKDKELIAENYFHNYFYSNYAVRRESFKLLLDHIKSAAEKQGVNIVESVVESRINQILDEAFNEDQRQILQKQVKGLLSA